MKNRNVFWGVFFILSAVAIILNQLGLLVGVSLTSLFLTILLIPIIVTSLKHMNFSGILIPLAIIGILYDDVLGIQSLTPWPILGAAIFLSIGLSFLIHPKQYHFEKHYGKNEGFDDEESIDGTNQEEINLFTKFSGSIKYINSNDLKKVNLDCSFGAMKVYFDNAKIESNEALIDLNVDFAGVELYVPKDWNIVNDVNCIFGGVEEKNKNKRESSTQRTLVLRGRVSFAGVEIIYV